MSDRTVKVVGKHIKGCGAVREVKEGNWDNCWGSVAYGEYGHPIVTTERRYGKNGRVFKRWLRYLCNDIHCRAELHVDTDALLSTILPKD